MNGPQTGSYHRGVRAARGHSSRFGVSASTTPALPADVTSCGKPMTDMHLWNTPLARVRAILVATIALGVLLFAVTTTHATATKQQTHNGPAAAGQSAGPAGPRGPVTLSCRANGDGVTVAAGPAGPQGPVGVNCAARPNG